MIDKKLLCIINSIVNYYANADQKATEKLSLVGEIILKKIEDLLKEEEFFEEWGVYEKNTPTTFADDEKKLIYELIRKAEKDYLNKDVDIRAILDLEDLKYLKSKSL